VEFTFKFKGCRIFLLKDLHKNSNRVNITHQVEVILKWMAREKRRQRFL
jgi:hypothetical protein